MFWKQADFGFAKERLEEVRVLCRPENTVGIAALMSLLVIDVTDQVVV